MYCRLDDVRSESIRCRSSGPDRAADHEHAGVCDGWGDESSADWGDRRVVHRRSGAGERVFGPGGVDGRTVCTEPVWEEGRGAIVPDGGFGEMEMGREPGVCGAEGSSGKDSRVSDRVRGDRGGIAGAWRDPGSGGFGAGG